MKRIIYLFLLLIGCTFLSNAQTNVSGSLSGSITWTKANSPYVLNGDVSLNFGAVLTIEPGVLVRSNGTHQLKVGNSASLVASGTVTDSIKFEVPTQSKYMILFSGANTSQSRFDYVSVQGIGTENHENRFIETTQVTGGNGSQLSISNSLIHKVSIKVDDTGGRINLLTDQVKRTFLWSEYDGAGYDIEGSNFTYSSITQELLPWSPNLREGITTLSNSNFFNTPIRLLASTVNIQGCQFMMDDGNVEHSPGKKANAVLAVGELIISKSVVDSDEMLAIVVQDRFGDGHNRIENNVFLNVSHVLNVQEHQSTQFTKNDLYGLQSHQLFALISRKDVVGTGNYIYGITDHDVLQGLVFSSNSAKIDLGDTKAQPINTDLLVFPTPVIRRIVENDDYSNQIELDWTTDQITIYDRYRVYQFSDNDSFKLFGEYSPNEKPRFDFGTDNRYYVLGVHSTGKTSIRARAKNTSPQILSFTEPRFGGTRSEYNIPIKVVNREGDLVKLSLTDLQGSTIIDVKSFELTKNGTSGDTLLYNLNVVPEADEYGQFFKLLHYEDGLNNGLSGLGFRVVRIPEVTQVRVIEGEEEGFVYSVNQTELEKSIDWIAEPWKNVKIKITKVLNGKLFYDDEVIQSIDEIPDHSFRFPKLQWKAPLQTGEVDAFEIKLFDDENESVETTVIKFNLLPNQAPVLTAVEPIENAREDERAWLNFHTFLQNVSVTDAENHEISLVITELLNGNITYGYPKEQEMTLPFEFTRNDGSRVVYWYPPANENGMIDGFKIRAYDGSKLSENELTVQFDVSPVNDPPSFDYVSAPPLGPVSHQIESIKITGITPGPKEEESLSMSVTVSDNEIMPQNWVELIYEQGSDEALLRYLPQNDLQGSVHLDINLHDGSHSYTQSVPFSFQKDNQAPALSPGTGLKAYVNYQYNLPYDIDDNRPVVIAQTSSNSSWLNIDNRLRIKQLNEEQNYNTTQRDGFIEQAVVSSIWHATPDKHGNVWYSAGTQVKILTANGLVMPVAGAGTSGYMDGQGPLARFSFIQDLVYDEEKDLLYVMDANNDVIRSIDQNFTVTTLYDATELGEIRSLGKGAMDESGNLIFELRFDGDVASKLYKLSPDGTASFFAGSGEGTTEPLTGSKEVINIFDLDGLEVVNGEVFFISNSIFRKIKTDGQVEQIELPEVLVQTNYGSDSQMARDGGSLLIFQRQGRKLVRLNPSDLTYEIILGEEDKPYEEGMLASGFTANGFSGYYLNNFAVYPDKGIIMSLGKTSTSLLALVYQATDSISGIPAKEDIGVHQVQFMLKDMDGLETTSTVSIEVLANNQIEATNLNQNLVFDEDSPVINPAIIVLSGLPTGEEAKVEIKLDKRQVGHFTADSGSGEQYIDSLGLWSITGTQAEANAALAALRFIPSPNYDRDFEARVLVVNAAGGVPNEGLWSFDITPVADPPGLVGELKDSAYVAIDYTYQFEGTDVEGDIFSFEVESTPEWLSYTRGPWYADDYAGLNTSSWSQRQDGSLKTARFRDPTLVEKDKKGNLYVRESDAVRKITPAGEVSTLFVNGYGYADGPLVTARISWVGGFTFDDEGNMYIADTGNRRIRMLTPDGQVSTIAGSGIAGFLNGPALDAQFLTPTVMKFDSNGNLYIVDNGFVKKLDTNGQVSTIAGNAGYGYGIGNPLEVSFSGIQDLAFDNNGHLLIADGLSIRRLNMQTNELEAVVGGFNSCCTVTGALEDVLFRDLKGIEVTADGKIYFSANGLFAVIDEEANQATLLTTGSYNGLSVGELSNVNFEELQGFVNVGGDFFAADRREDVIKRIYRKPGLLSGTPAASDLGDNTVKLVLTDHIGQERSVDFDITVFNNDFPNLNGLDDTYTYIEDQDLTFSGFELANENTDEFEVKLGLSDPMPGALLLTASTQITMDSDTSWTITGTASEVNGVLQALVYKPIPGSFAKNRVHVEASRIGGLFVKSGNLFIEGQALEDNPKFGELSDVDAMVGVAIEEPLPMSDEDFEPVLLSASGLPDGFALQKSGNSRVRTIAGNGQRDYLPTEGPLLDRGMIIPRLITLGPEERLYFIDDTYIKYLTEDSVKFYNPDALGYTNYPRDLYFRNGQLYFTTASGVFKIDPTGAPELYVGTGTYGDKDGAASEAAFLRLTDIVPGPGTRDFYVLDIEAKKIKYVDDDLNVTTLFAVGDNDGVSLEEPVSLTTDGEGNYYIYDTRAPYPLKQFVHEGKLMNMPVEGAPWGFSLGYAYKKITPDGLGNLLLIGSARIDLLDINGNISRLSGNGVLNGDGEGDGSNVSLGKVLDVVVTDRGKIAYADGRNLKIKTIDFEFEYQLQGIAKEESIGEHVIALTATDGQNNSDEAEFTLRILASDEPEVTNLDQMIAYVEDDVNVPIGPITIVGESQEQFKAIFDYLPSALGEISSLSNMISPQIDGQLLSFTGTITQLNEVLSQLVFNPLPDNVNTQQIGVSVVLANGVRMAQGIIELQATPVNDLPKIMVDYVDTTVFVGNQLILGIEATDAEGAVNYANRAEWPQWLSPQQMSLKTELLAGIPGESGTANGPRLESSFEFASSIDVDSKGNIYVAEPIKDIIRKITPEGEVVTFSGSGQRGYLDGAPNEAQFDRPVELVIDKYDNVYVAGFNNRIRKIDQEGNVTTVAGNGEDADQVGLALEAAFGTVEKMLYVPPLHSVFILDPSNSSVKVLDLEAKEVSEFTPNPAYWQGVFANSKDLALGPNDVLYLLDDKSVHMFDLNGNGLGSLTSSSGFASVEDGFTYNSRLQSNRLFVTATGKVIINDLSFKKLRYIDNSRVTTFNANQSLFYGEGFDQQVGIGQVRDFVQLKDGSFLYSDTQNRLIRRVWLDPTVLTGTPTSADAGQLNFDVKVQDNEAQEASIALFIDVRDETPLQVTGLGQAFIYEEGTLEVDFPLLKINDEFQAKVEVLIHKEAGAGNIGVDADSFIPFDTEKNLWSINESIDSLNALFGHLKYFPDASSKEDMLLKYEFTRGGEKQKQFGDITFIYKELNNEPAYTGPLETEIEVGENLDFALLAQDSDGDTLTYFIKEPLPWIIKNEEWYVQRFFTPNFSENFNDSLIALNYFWPSGLVETDSGDVIMTNTINGRIEGLTRDTERFVVYENNPSELTLLGPRDMIYDADSSLVYVNGAVRQIRNIDQKGKNTLITGNGTGAAQDGIGSNVILNNPVKVVRDDEENLYVIGQNVHTIRKIHKNGLVTTYAGVEGEGKTIDGNLSEARLNWPTALKWHKGELYFLQSNYLRKISNGEIITLAGRDTLANIDGPLEKAAFTGLTDLVVLNDTTLLLTGLNERSVRQVDLKNGMVTTIAGNDRTDNEVGPALETNLRGPNRIYGQSDGSFLIWSVADNSLKRLSKSTNSLTGVPSSEHVGQHQIKVRVSDGHGGEVEQVITINVLPFNEPPTVETIETQVTTYMSEGTFVIGLFDYFADAETADGELIYEVISNSNLTVATSQVINAADGLLKLDLQNVGTTDLTLRATDEGGKSVETTFILTVEKATAEISFGANEVVFDGSAKSVEIITNPEGLNVNITYDESAEAPTAIGTYQVKGVIDDDNYEGESTTTFTIVAPNTAPEVTAIGDQTAAYTPGGSIQISLFDYFSDAESANTELTYEVTSNTDATIVTGEAISAADGLLNLNMLKVGETDLQVKVTDTDGASVSTSFKVAITNTAPEVNTIGDQSVVYTPDGSIQVSLFDYFSDAESADTELTYEVTSNTDATVVTSDAISATDGLLTLKVQAAGESTLTVKATDVAGESVSTSFKVTISKAAATITFGTAEYINDGITKEVSVTTDPAGLAYTITYDGGDVLPSSPGDYAVAVTIDDDNYQGSSNTTMSIINVAPEALELSGGIVLENQASGAEVGGLSVTDQNLNDTHTYALPEGLTDNASFSVNGDKLLTATAFDYEEKGSYIVTVEVTDNNGGSYREELSIAISDVNDAPGLGAYDDIQVVLDLGQLSIQIDGLSTGGDASQTVSISTITSGSVATASTTANSGNESVTVNFETATGVQGSGTIEITVKDNGGTANGGVDTFTRVVNVSVLPANITTTDGGICGPGSVTLTASGADAYAWYTQPLEGTAFQTGNELSENITEAVTYYVAGVFGADESKLRVPVSAVIFDALELPVISNSNGLLSVPDQTGMTYQWLLDGANLDGATAASFTPLVNGSYSVTITNSNGCSATSGSLPVLVTSVEAPEPTIEVLLYPNPASEFVDLDFGQLLSKGTSIRLMDNTGRELQLQVLDKAAETVRLDVTRLGEGIHLILINDQGLTIRKRLMIKR